MESHRNYNTPEELKKNAEGSQLVIPGSLVNHGNPSEKKIQHMTQDEYNEGGEREYTDIVPAEKASSYFNYRTIYLKPVVPKLRQIRSKV